MGIVHYIISPGGVFVAKKHKQRPVGGRHVGRTIGKIFGTLVLVGFLTLLIFACIFAMYIKNDLSKQLYYSV